METDHLDRLQAALATKEYQISQLKVVVYQEKKRRRNAENTIKELQQRSQEEVVQLQDECIKLKEGLCDAQQENERLCNYISRLPTAQAYRQLKHNQKEGSIQELEVDLHKTTDTLREATGMLKAMQKQCEASEAKKAALAKQVTQVEADLHAVMQRYEAGDPNPLWTIEMEKLRNDCASLRQEKEDAERQVKETEKRHRKQERLLSIELSLAQESKRQQIESAKAIQALLQQETLAKEEAIQQLQLLQERYQVTDEERTTMRLLFQKLQHTAQDMSRMGSAIKNLQEGGDLDTGVLFLAGDLSFWESLGAMEGEAHRGYPKEGSVLGWLQERVKEVDRIQGQLDQVRKLVIDICARRTANAIDGSCFLQ